MDTPGVVGTNPLSAHDSHPRAHMSGIAGIWNRGGQPVLRVQLANLSERLAHRGPDGEEFWVQGAVGFACRLNRITPEAAAETQPLVHRSGSVLVFDGRLDNREELLARLHLSPDVSSGCPDPTLVLAAYAEFGDGFPEMLAGDFALGLFDPKNQRLVLARDAVGVRPLYYIQTRDTFLFASEIKALLAHPQVEACPNDDFLANLMIGNTQDTDGMTCFKGVASVLPAHVVVVTPQGIATSRYWDFDINRRTRLGSFQEYAEGFRFHFEQAIRRRLRSAHPVAVSVSGGLDSSSILCLAETLRERSPGQYPSILGITYTTPDGSPSDEKAFLPEIERHYAVSIARVPMGPLGWVDGSSEAVWQSETPYLANQWNTTRVFLREARQREARTILTGHWGDQILFPPGYLIDLFYRLEWNQIRSHLHEYSRWLSDVDPRTIRRHLCWGLMQYHVPDVLVPWWRRVRARRCSPWYSASFRSRVSRRASTGSARRLRFPSAHVQCLYEQARSGSHVQCMEWNNKIAATQGLEAAFPFLDRDLISFLMSIPGEMQTYNGVPKALLREAMQGVLPNAIIRRTWKADFTHLVNDGWAQDLPRLLHWLRPDAAAIKMGYLIGDVIRAELSRLQSRISDSNCRAAWHLSNILGLELWLRAFCGGKQGYEMAGSASDSDYNNILS